MLLAVSSATHVFVTKIYLFRLCIYTALTIFASATCGRLSFSNFWCGYRCRGFFAHVDSFEKGRKCCCIHKFIDMRLALTMIGNTRALFHFFSIFNRMIMSINVPYGTVELLDQVTPERRSHRHADDGGDKDGENWNRGCSRSNRSISSANRSISGEL